MRFIKLFSLIILLTFQVACLNQEDDTIVPPSVPEEEETIVEEDVEVEGCVQEEEITSTLTGVKDFLEGPQEEGWARGIKINEHWEATGKLLWNESFFSFGLTTYWEESIPEQNDYILAELLVITLPYNTEAGICYNLRNESDISFQTDSVFCHHNVYFADVAEVIYQIDTSALNTVEIIEFNRAEEQLKAKLQASFVAEEAFPPEFPDSIRFFNVDIEIGY